jgi:membrane fusion protein, copper/silver efflux system
MNNITATKIAVAVGLSLLLLSGGFFIGQSLANKNPAAAKANSAHSPSKEKRVLYWYDPMVPNQHFDQPGPSPFMDMALVPKYAAGGDTGDDPAVSQNALSIDPGITQNLGMRLAKVERMALQRELNATGTLKFNARTAAVVQLRSPGFVEKVWPLAVGDMLVKGQPIAEFLMPEWASAQYEYLAVKTTGDKHLLHSARTRMELLGMPQAAISALETSGKVQQTFIVRAPIAGAIQQLKVKNGMTFNRGATLARINNLDQLWLDAALPEDQANVFKAGDSAAFYPNSHDTTTVLSGVIATLLPSLNTSSRTLTARILIDNKARLLKPGATGRVLLRSQPKPQTFGLALPTEAILHSGQKAMVLLALGKGKFRPAQILIGAELGDKTLVLSGLSEGQEVVASAQFILDSEASMLGIRTQALAHSAIDTSELHQASGKLLELLPGKVRIAHGAFSSQRDGRTTMDAMSMRFSLDSPWLTQGLAVGDELRISARINSEGYWILVALEKIARATDTKSTDATDATDATTMNNNHPEHQHD